MGIKDLFNENSILIDIIKTNILNSENLNAKIDFNVNDITNINELNSLNLKLNIDQGAISLAGSSIMWKDSCKIFLSEVGLYDASGELMAVGRLSSPINKNFSSEAIVKVRLTY